MLSVLALALSLTAAAGGQDDHRQAALDRIAAQLSEQTKGALFRYQNDAAPGASLALRGIAIGLKVERAEIRYEARPGWCTDRTENDSRCRWAMRTLLFAPRDIDPHSIKAHWYGPYVSSAVRMSGGVVSLSCGKAAGACVATRAKPQVNLIVACRDEAACGHMATNWRRVLAAATSGSSPAVSSKSESGDDAEMKSLSDRINDMLLRHGGQAWASMYVARNGVGYNANKWILFQFGGSKVGYTYGGSLHQCSYHKKIEECLAKRQAEWATSLVANQPVEALNPDDIHLVLSGIGQEHSNFVAVSRDLSLGCDPATCKELAALLKKFVTLARRNNPSARSHASDKRREHAPESFSKDRFDYVVNYNGRLNKAIIGAQLICPDCRPPSAYRMETVLASRDGSLDIQYAVCRDARSVDACKPGGPWQARHDRLALASIDIDSIAVRPFSSGIDVDFQSWADPGAGPSKHYAILCRDTASCQTVAKNLRTLVALAMFPR